MRQLLEEDLFHADLHPGNIVLLRDSHIALIDLGTLGSVERELLRKYLFTMKALARRDYQRAADLILSLTPNFPAVDLTPVREQMVRQLRSWEMRTALKGLSYHEKSLTKAFTDVTQTMAASRIMVTWAFLKIDRTWATMDASLYYVFPTVNYPKLFRRYFRQRDRRLARQLVKPNNLMAAVMDIPDSISEYQLFVDPQIRRASRTFSGIRNRMHDALSAGFQILSVTTLLGTMFLVAAFLDQHHAVPTFAQYDIVLTPIREIPLIEYELWFPPIALGFYLFFKFRALRRSFAKESLRLPGNTSLG